jgi:hypothetical protein
MAVLAAPAEHAGAVQLEAGVATGESVMWTPLIILCMKKLTKYDQGGLNDRLAGG